MRWGDPPGIRAREMRRQGRAEAVNGRTELERLELHAGAIGDRRPIWVDADAMMVLVGGFPGLLLSRALPALDPTQRRAPENHGFHGQTAKRALAAPAAAQTLARRTPI